MAIILDENKEKDKEMQSPGTTQVAPGISSSIPQQTSGAFDIQRTGSGQFQNVRGFLEANKGGAEKLATGVGQSLETRGSDIKAGIEAAKTGFGTQTATTQQRLTGGEEFIKQGIQQAQLGQTLTSPQDQQRFSQLRSGYIENISPQEQQLSQLQQREQDLSKLAQSATTQPGRFELLKNTITSPQYSAGQQRLDALLLGRDKDASQNLLAKTKDISSQYGQLSKSELESQRIKVSELKNTARQFAQQATTGISGALSGLESSFNVDSQARQKAREAQQAQLSTQIEEQTKAGNITEAARLAQTATGQQFSPELLKQLEGFDKAKIAEGLFSGLTPQEKAHFEQTGGTSAYNNYLKEMSRVFNPESFLQISDPLSQSQLATEDERRRYQALTSLADTATTGQYGNLAAALGGQSQQADGLATLNEGILQSQTQALDTARKSMEDRLAFAKQSAKYQIATDQVVRDILSGNLVPSVQSILTAHPELNADWATEAIKRANSFRSGDTSQTLEAMRGDTQESQQAAVIRIQQALAKEQEKLNPAMEAASRAASLIRPSDLKSEDSVNRVIQEIQGQFPYLSDAQLRQVALRSVGK